MTYNPNPFEFVPFKRTKIVDPVKCDTSKMLYSGWLKVSLKALTPIHIAGRQEPIPNKVGAKISSSSFYLQDGIPTIPGSSIKGMLRTFLEALTCGWVSQANDIYPKVRGTRTTKGRHVGFGAFSEYPNVHRSSLPPHSWSADPFIAAMFKPESSLVKVDIPTYMFGIVTNKENPSTESKAMRAKVLFEDCLLSSESLREFEIPDIEGEAFMGGAHPSASSWWYMLPDEIWRRNTGGHTVAELVGLSYRGRKFYFHQDPKQCINWYDQNWVRLNQRPNKPPIPYYKYKMKCICPESNAEFRVYVDRLPSSFFALLCLLLTPGENIKHKLGYGKAYGYGSLKLEIKEALLRVEKEADWPEPLLNRKSVVSEIITGGFSDQNLKKNGISTVIDRPSLDALARILGCHLHDAEQKSLIFSYPPFDRTNFARPIDFTEVQDILKDKSIVPEPKYPFKYIMNQNQHGAVINHGKDIATYLLNSGIKRSIHLGAYQENANGYKDIIMKRTP